MCGPVRAQSASEPDTAELETVEVIGSRIRNADIVDQVPVQTITAEEIRDSGVKSIGDLLQRMSVSGSSLNTKFNSAGNFGFPADGGGVGSGSTTVSLRHLDARRTLVLVDGIRWVNESSGSGVSASVDLNTIPLAAIERIEVLTDGASSLYGSDAIAGVVNIVTRSRGEGLTLDLYGGDYETGDGATNTASLSFGADTGKLRFFTDFSYYDQDGISSSAWDQSYYPVPGTGVDNGSSGIPTTRTIFLADNSYGGLCDADDDIYVCDIAGNGTAADGVPAFPDEFHGFSNADRFNFAPYNLLLTPSERKSAFTQVQYDLHSNVTLYGRALYQNRVSVNQAASEPIFIGPEGGTGLAATIGVDATNPYNPFGFTLGPDNLVFAARRPLEGGPRIFSQDVDTLYFAGGLRGNFVVGPGRYDWDVNAISGTNEALQTVQGTYNLAHLQRALGPVADCTAPCVPLNFFGGPGTITPEMLEYIGFVENDRSEQNINGWSANITGPIFTLPAGALMFATGYESRRLSGDYAPDPIVVAGEGNGVPSSATHGGYDVDEMYAELSIPLLAGMTGAQALDLSLATRWSDYSTFGDTTNNKYGLRWQPLKDLTLRGTYSEGFRAPSIGELYASESRFDATIEDPCVNPADPVLVANCVALGVPDPEQFQQSNSQIGVDTGGNKTLQPETSDSTTAGFVYSPAWAEKLSWTKRLDFEVTWYHIEIDNAIQAPDAQTQLDRCVATLDPAYCNGIVRSIPSEDNPTGTGNIVEFSSQLQNLGTVETEGLDAMVSWASPGYGFGRLGAVLQATYVTSYEAIANDTGAVEPRKVGVEVTDSAIPRVKGQLRLEWALASWQANWTTRYVSELTEDCGAAVGYSTCSNTVYNADGAAVGGSNTLDATWYQDVRLQYHLMQPMDLTLAGGVNNVFGEDPPVCVSCSLNGYDASNYDLPGSFSYVQATLRY